MGILQNLRQTLHKPFPEAQSVSQIFKQILAVSIFITLFLFLFSPTEVSIYQSVWKRFLVSLGFGMTTFITSFAYDFLVTKLFKLRSSGTKFTFGKWVMYIFGVVLCIGIANFFFASYLSGNIRWSNLSGIIQGTFLVGIIPMVGLGAILMWQQEKKYLTIASEINEKRSTTTSQQNTSNDHLILGIPSNQIKYIESLQNYVRIGFVANGEFKEQTERATLKGILNETKNGAIVKCHRSFLVNREAIISTSGNAQGLILTLSNCNKQIPVSRSYISFFKENKPF